MSYFIDTHSHLFAEEFNDDREKAISRALENNVRKLVIPNIDSSTIDAVIGLCNSHMGVCFPAIGLHPSSVTKDFQDEIEIIKTRLSGASFCAMGEIGIDLYWDKTFIEEQIDSFIQQVKLADEYNLPLIIHSRKSLDEIINILKHNAMKNTRGVFHCFPGSIEQAMAVIEMGFVIGIGGVVTYKNAGMAEVVRKTDISKILLETDSPYLTPAPMRGSRNESSNIVHIAQKIAEIKGIPIQEVAKNTTKTAERMFNI